MEIESPLGKGKELREHAEKQLHIFVERGHDIIADSMLHKLTLKGVRDWVWNMSMASMKAGFVVGALSALPAAGYVVYTILKMVHLMKSSKVN